MSMLVEHLFHLIQFRIIAAFLNEVVPKMQEDNRKHTAIRDNKQAVNLFIIRRFLTTR